MARSVCRVLVQLQMQFYLANCNRFLATLMRLPRLAYVHGTWHKRGRVLRNGDGRETGGFVSLGRVSLSSNKAAAIAYDALL